VKKCLFLNEFDTASHESFDVRIGHTLSSYVQYYHRTRTHFSLDMDCPQTRSISQPTASKIIAFPEVGGLHHRYERRAA
jgi:hypothetical protein